VKESVQALAQLTNELTFVESMLSIEKVKYEESIKSLLAKKEEITKNIETQKEAVKTEALQEYIISNSKKLYGGIGVQERNEVTYDEVAVLDWCKEKKMFLTLDKKAFEKVAENIGAPTVVVSKKTIVTFPKEYKLEESK